MKGSENNWNPRQCRDSNCPQNAKGAHMHCPFCVKTEAFHDPVILRAHFRVKHVDKGLDFAGLKVLRCCEQCEIIGAIKGEKKFKGAHWHCYKCRNGFNRRDEAMKHYKTHFRNPHTTFQIQIVQDLGNTDAWDTTATSGDMLSQSTSISVPAGITEEITIHPVLTEAVMTTAPSTGSDSDVSLSKDSDSNHTIAANGLAVAATETVNSEGSSQAVILIESVSATDSIHEEDTTIYRTVGDDAAYMKKDNMEPKVQMLEKQLAQLQQEKNQVEKQLKAEIQKLRNQVQNLTNSNTILQQQLQCTQNATLQRLPADTQADIEQLIGHMEQQYSSLLHHHLGQLRQYYQPEDPSDSTEEMAPSVEQASEYDSATTTAATQDLDHIVVTTQSASTVDIGAETVTTTALGEICRDSNRDTDLVITEGHYIVKNNKSNKDGVPELVIVEINNKSDDATEETETVSQKRKNYSESDNSEDAKRNRNT